MPRKIMTIYEQFNSYSKEQVNDAISKLSAFDKQMIQFRYGDDLDNPHTYENWNSSMRIEFYGSVIPRLKRLLEGKPQKRSRTEKSIDSLLSNKNDLNSASSSAKSLDGISGTNGADAMQGNEVEFGLNSQTADAANTNVGEVNTSSTTQDAIDENANISVKNEKDTSENADRLTRNDYLKILRLLKAPTMLEMLQTLSPKEVVIIILRLGYIDEVYYSEEKIAKFLGIEIEKVKETIKNVLSLHRDKFNNFIDDAIDAVSGTQRVMLPKKDVRK